MQECHAANEASPAGRLGAGVMTYRSLGFAKSARYRLSTAGAAFACTRDDDRSWPRFLFKSM
jgi:hypothetical protein